MKRKKLNALVVDDHPIILRAIEGELKRHCNVFSALEAETAREFLLSTHFDFGLIDVNLDGASGFTVARWCRDLNPNMVVIMMTGATALPSNWYDYKHRIVDDFILKTLKVEILMDTVQNAIWQKNMPSITMLKRYKILSPLLKYEHLMNFFCRTGDNDGAERIDGIMTADKLPVTVVVYNRPERKDNKCYICISSSSGCIGCLQCKSRSRLIKNGRIWTKGELIAQMLWGMQSYHARGLFEEKKHLVFNFSTEGDCMFLNPKNSCQAVEEMDKALKSGGIPVSYIMTTVGHEKNLAWFLENYSHLPIIFHWSVHFRPELRKKYMCAASTQSLEVMRDLFCEIFAKTKRTTVVAWAVAKGLNDTEEDVKWLAEFVRNRPFRINVTAMADGSLAGVPQTTDQDRTAFADKLRAKGLDVQERVNLGRGINASCGLTIPDIIIADIIAPRYD
ncbi:MAG: hypothetical protein A2528_03240 [Candidatus Staskawiczbacteria bacterium RIFOXYD2_FULL_37_9]|uniref:Response regulatory domain-containing protein n=1 Tax=Candidatus Staskawiczbacteria bacterium RIFOXYB1_FULL_37_44 TaxID=1802223 RepID=A0A1G2IX78_9BACT|nr:MAG: hypothetical protein A2358_00550 [Candidatus Staskawiczbacteria bacterium RIFOXYB1_FULL_37_44]OGZ83500.1 MAG: hypothetical protein A2416_04215 [Candidatus Staskawiczbacteria bacterium RIFOXYC1_FULL_37_52]OGZ87930.1 MAG: hypothetical protein A2444_02170 [Candidatus Staskawiczbacteria bacterium RIFOXYC2_FULL_37_19]OGZ90162.1 MAG: hypothetical protein A2581_01985 [Candidatus Staskawiczbacteria bacterium RIFOXYD1_FULL_37_110]OGZ93724.1 MAG: hypothetical protein A2528_03240 [Candidatus Stask